MMRLAAVLTLVALAAPLAAQDPMPITVKPKGRLVLPGAPVILTGSTVADGKRFDVHVTVVKPDNQSEAGSAKVDAQGNYTITYNGGKLPGRYRVTAVAPDGQGHDTTSFSVAPPGDFATTASDAVQHIVADGVEIENRLSEALEELPESPAKEEVKE